MMEDLLEIFDLMPSCCGVLGYVAAGLLVCWGLLYLWSFRKVYSLKGKHVLVTGGSSGIGKAVAAEALRRGAAAVTLVARTEDKLKTARNELIRLISAKLPQKVYTIAADVSSVSVKESLQKGLTNLPPVDVLVNSAGVSFTGSLLDTSPETFENQLRVNVLGSVYPTQALLPDMLSRRQGRIVFISSMAGQMAVYGYTAYSAAKFGVRGLAEVLDMEVRSHNIGVSISYPPEVNTPMLQEEVPHRSAIVKSQCGFGSVFKAESIARDICRGVERGQFQINHGFDGFILGTVTAGMAPVYHLSEGIVQILLMGLFRLVGFVYILLFYRIVHKGLEKIEKSK